MTTHQSLQEITFQFISSKTTKQISTSLNLLYSHLCTLPQQSTESTESTETTETTNTLPTEIHNKLSKLLSNNSNLNKQIINTIIQILRIEAPNTNFTEFSLFFRNLLNLLQEDKEGVDLEVLIETKSILLIFECDDAKDLVFSFCSLVSRFNPNANTSNPNPNLNPNLVELVSIIVENDDLYTLDYIYFLPFEIIIKFKEKLHFFVSLYFSEQIQLYVKQSEEDDCKSECKSEVSTRNTRTRNNKTLTKTPTKLITQRKSIKSHNTSTGSFSLASIISLHKWITSLSSVCILSITPILSYELNLPLKQLRILSLKTISLFIIKEGIEFEFSGDDRDVRIEFLQCLVYLIKNSTNSLKIEDKGVEKWCGLLCEMTMDVDDCVRCFGVKCCYDVLEYLITSNDTNTTTNLQSPIISKLVEAITSRIRDKKWKVRNEASLALVYLFKKFVLFVKEIVYVDFEYYCLVLECEGDVLSVFELLSSDDNAKERDLEKMKKTFCKKLSCGDKSEFKKLIELFIRLKGNLPTPKPNSNSSFTSEELQILYKFFNEYEFLKEFCLSNNQKMYEFILKIYDCDFSERERMIERVCAVFGEKTEKNHSNQAKPNETKESGMKDEFELFEPTKFTSSTIPKGKWYLLFRNVFGLFYEDGCYLIKEFINGNSCLREIIEECESFHGSGGILFEYFMNFDGRLIQDGNSRGLGNDSMDVDNSCFKFSCLETLVKLYSKFPREIMNDKLVEKMMEFCCVEFGKVAKYAMRCLCKLNEVRGTGNDEVIELFELINDKDVKIKSMVCLEVVRRGKIDDSRVNQFIENVLSELEVLVTTASVDILKYYAKIVFYKNQNAKPSKEIKRVIQVLLKYMKSEEELRLCSAKLLLLYTKYISDLNIIHEIYSVTHDESYEVRNSFLRKLCLYISNFKVHSRYPPPLKI